MDEIEFFISKSVLLEMLHSKFPETAQLMYWTETVNKFRIFSVVMEPSFWARTGPFSVQKQAGYITLL